MGELEDVADVHSNDDSKLLCDQRYKLLHFEKAVVSSVSTCTHSKSSNNECQSTTSNSNYDHYSLPFFYYDLKGCAQAITPVYAASVRLSAFKKLTGIGNNAYMHRGEGLGGKGNVLCIGHVCIHWTRAFEILLDIFEAFVLKRLYTISVKIFGASLAWDH